MNPNFRILVADDEKAIRETYLNILMPPARQNAWEKLASELLGDHALNFLEQDLTPGEDWELPALEAGITTSQTYDVVVVGQGQQAVEVFQQAQAEGHPFSLVFLDMRMPPGINGMETATQIRAFDPLAEIVIMTAYSDFSFQEIIQKVGNANRLFYYHKPFDPEQLQGLACSLTQRWALEQKAYDQNRLS